jgi:hypothetical protein
MIHHLVCSKVWVLSGSPYEIKKTLAEVRRLLQKGATMPEDFFNLGVRYLAYREAKRMKYYAKVAKHHMDLHFCVS